MKKLLLAVSLLIFSGLLLAQPSLTKDNKLMDVIVVDMNHDGKLSAKSVRHDGDGVLVLYTKDEEGKVPVLKPDMQHIRVVPGHDNLSSLDQDKNGRIDAHDASYHYLYLMVYYQGGNRYKIVPVGHAGVRAMFLDQKYMKASSVNDAKGFQDVSKKAVMSDGSKRHIKQIKVEKDLLDSVKQP